jgi:hypothetical protein
LCLLFLCPPFTGKQLTPNQIRGQIRKYIAENKNISQAKFLSIIDVSVHVFDRFMNAKNNKEDWKATENITYANAASFLAKQKVQHKIAALEDKAAEKTNFGKRTSSEVEAVSALADLSVPQLTIPSKKQAKADLNAMLKAIVAVEMAEDVAIYADCDEIRRTLTKFFNTSGVTEGAWLRVVQCQSKSLNSFRGFRGPSAGAANNIFSKAWRFFEQKRVLEGRHKTPQQLEAEERLGPAGYSRKHIDPKKRGGWLFVPQLSVEARGGVDRVHHHSHHGSSDSHSYNHNRNHSHIHNYNDSPGVNSPSRPTSPTTSPTSPRSMSSSLNSSFNSSSCSDDEDTRDSSSWCPD